MPRRSTRLLGRLPDQNEHPSSIPRSLSIEPIAAPLPTINPQAASGLWKLSSEIRNMIYRLLVVKPKCRQPIEPNIDELFKRAEQLEKTEQPPPNETFLAFARTCHLAHGEITASYYGENHFSFKGTWEIYVYLYMIGWHNRRCLMDVKVVWSGTDLASARNAAALIGECKRLRYLTIRVNEYTTYGAPGKTLYNLSKASHPKQLKSIKGLLNVNVSIIDKYKCFKAEHVSDFQRLLQEEMRKEGDPDLEFQDEIEKQRERDERRKMLGN